MSECQTKAGNQECFEKLTHSLTLDMLNNFCFHVYAQYSLIIGENGNCFFDSLITLPCYFRVLKITY